MCCVFFTSMDKESCRQLELAASVTHRLTVCSSLSVASLDYYLQSFSRSVTTYISEACAIHQNHRFKSPFLFRFKDTNTACVNSAYVSVGVEVETGIVGVWSKGLQLEKCKWAECLSPCHHLELRCPWAIKQQSCRGNVDRVHRASTTEATSRNKIFPFLCDDSMKKVGKRLRL